MSPLLANIVLDDLDKELEGQGLRFVRHADDANIYVRSKRAGEKVMAGVRRFLQERLRLRANEAKSATGRRPKPEPEHGAAGQSPKCLPARVG